MTTSKLVSESLRVLPPIDTNFDFYNSAISQNAPPLETVLYSGRPKSERDRTDTRRPVKIESWRIEYFPAGGQRSATLISIHFTFSDIFVTPSAGFGLMY